MINNRKQQNHRPTDQVSCLSDADEYEKSSH